MTLRSRAEAKLYCDQRDNGGVGVTGGFGNLGIGNDLGGLGGYGGLGYDSGLGGGLTSGSCNFGSVSSEPNRALLSLLAPHVSYVPKH